MAFPGQPRGPVNLEDFGLADIQAQLAELAATEITIGWQGASGAEIHPGSDDATVAEIAAFHELGTVRMPARPALETAFARNEKAFTDAVGKAMSDLIDGRSSGVSAAVKAIGEVAIEAVRKAIDDSRSWAEPLAPSTIARKGHDHPLVETKHMRNAVSYAERRGGVIVIQGGEK